MYVLWLFVQLGVYLFVVYRITVTLQKWLRNRVAARGTAADAGAAVSVAAVSAISSTYFVGDDDDDDDGSFPLVNSETGLPMTSGGVDSMGSPMGFNLSDTSDSSSTSMFDDD